MGLLDVLNQYQQQPNRPPPQIFEDFDQVAREADPDDLGFGLEEAFNSDITPPAEQMIGQLYERSDDDQRAGLLNEILGSLGGGATGGAAGGMLGGLLQRMAQGNRKFSPQEVRDFAPRDIEMAAAQAAQQDPNVIQKISRFYARHPQLVQTLGQAALGILMSGMARRRRVM
ncbi:MAG: hypothetical protein M3R58_10130 [Pseudomonadota bacterium]|nr:hypothetical protein [Pseudomonadota bacterium]